jgi:YD repeat-containing protein
MRTLLLFTSLLTVTTACGDEETCLHGVCADHSETRALPGPCAISTSSYLKRCDITYNPANRPAAASCTVFGGFEDETYHADATWTYDAAGEPATYEYRKGVMESYTRWTWDPTRVRVERLYMNEPPVLERLYDRALFAYDPEPTNVHVYPEAMLGLLVKVDGGMTTNYTWTREGNRLIQKSPAASSVFDLDDRGRLISINNGYTTYVYDGDRLESTNVNGQLTEYTYDAGGNVAESKGTYGHQVTYSYQCW